MKDEEIIERLGGPKKIRDALVSAVGRGAPTTAQAISNGKRNGIPAAWRHILMGMMEVDAAGRAPAQEKNEMTLIPTKGLTFRKGKREANVHDVKDGIVSYGVYLDGDYWPVGLYQATLDEWNRLATQAVEDGSVVFTRL